MFNLYNETITYDHQVKLTVPAGSDVKLLHNINTDETYVCMWEGDYVDVAVAGSVSAPSVPNSYNLAEQNLKGQTLVDQNGDTYTYFEVLNSKIEYEVIYTPGLSYKMIGVTETDANGAILSISNYRQVMK